MNKKAVDDYRDRMDSRLEELTIMGAGQKSDITHIKESVDEIKILVKEQNGRVRSNERAISTMRGVGSMISILFASVIGFLFKKGI